MTIADVTENAVLNLIFSSTLWANYATTVGVTSLETNIIVALHTADPGEAGTQSTNEGTVYTSYARQNVSRTTGWTTASVGQVFPAAAINFPAGTGGGPGPVTFVSTGKSGGGATPILLSGAVSPAITVGNGITPQLTTATVISLD